MTLQVIKPVTFSPAMLVSSTAAESAPAWAAGTTYAKGAVVDFGTHLYESLVNNNTGNNPATAPTFWLQTGPDNTHAMFDDQVNTATTATNSLAVVLAPGLVNSLALVNVRGSQVAITITDGPGGAVVFSRTIGLDGTIVTDWYQYFFEPFDFLSDVNVTGIPPYGAARVTITLTGVGAISIGNLVLGSLYELGEVLTSPSLTTDDYSLVTTDEFGNTTLVRRNSSKRAEMQVLLERSQMRKVFQVLDGLRATPAVWIPSQRGDDSPLSVYGIRSSFRIVVEYQNHCLCAIELKGMT